MAESIHQIHNQIAINFIPKREFDRIYAEEIDPVEKLNIVADMCRANTLAAVKRAGSGHLGSSFSAMDIVVSLYYQIMNTTRVGFDNPQRDIYFSSKGHDVPGLYSVLFAIGVIPRERFMLLRRLNGLDGHPDKQIPGIEANTGSLGMGISKGKGMAWAKRLRGDEGRVFVLTGDGEWQEGQNYEALQTAAHQKIDNLIVIMDHNKLQSDKLVSEILDIGDIETKVRDFGWHVARVDGHDIGGIIETLAAFDAVKGKPKLLIADTIKGRGVSFMEHPVALVEGNGFYNWHAGAPDDASFWAGHKELIERINSRLSDAQLGMLDMEDITPEAKPPSTVSKEYVAQAYGEALVQLGATRKDLVVLDADLTTDCHIRGFLNTYPDRFIENGIAEQDMVSMAAGLTAQGLLPVVNSFASFLASRANEQIYNAATEKGKIIYGCHFAGLIPAGPGKSHQSLRDISLFGALPNVTIIQPCNAVEAHRAVHYAVDQAEHNVVLRMNIGPSPRVIQLPADYKFKPGLGAQLTDGTDAVLFAYGPVMLHEALTASDLLQARSFGLKVVNMPWLNLADPVWLSEVVSDCAAVYVLEDHAPTGGLGDYLLGVLVEANLLQNKTFTKIAVEGFPACGTPTEALAHHRMDGASLAARIHP